MDLLTKILIAPIVIPHELSHYLMARLLGVEAKLHLTRVTYTDLPAGWRRILIYGAPIILGFGLQTLILYLAYGTDGYPYPLNHLLALFGSLFHLAWQAICVYDYLMIFRYLMIDKPSD